MERTHSYACTLRIQNVTKCCDPVEQTRGQKYHLHRLWISLVGKFIKFVSIGFILSITGGLSEEEQDFSPEQAPNHVDQYTLVMSSSEHPTICCGRRDCHGDLYTLGTCVRKLESVFESVQQVRKAWAGALPWPWRVDLSCKPSSVCCNRAE